MFHKPESLPHWTMQKSPNFSSPSNSVCNESQIELIRLSCHKLSTAKSDLTDHSIDMHICWHQNNQIHSRKSGQKWTLNYDPVISDSSSWYLISRFLIDRLTTNILWTWLKPKNHYGNKVHKFIKLRRAYLGTCVWG